jgi:hypothetical protein
MSKRILSAILFTIILTTVSVRAQDTDAAPMLTDSSRSIQFGIDYLALRTFNGKSISYKIHVSRFDALRFGISFSGSLNSEETTVKKYSGDTLISSSSSKETPDPNAYLMFTSEYLLYAPVSGDLYLFAGAGPQIGYSQTVYDYESSRSWSVGLGGSFGAEWFASRSISIHAEYTASLSYHMSSRSEWDVLSTLDRTLYETDESSLRLRSGNVLFGLSIYF